MTGASVVICTRDQAPRLRLTLRALAVQSVPPREVIVVDDGSADDTARVLADARTFLPCELHVVRLARPRGSAAARNEGAARAAGDLLVFLDSDALVTPDHVAHHLELQSEVDSHALVRAIASAGYEVTGAQSQDVRAEPAVRTHAASGGGCCCGPETTHRGRG